MIIDIYSGSYIRRALDAQELAAVDAWLRENEVARLACGLSRWEPQIEVVDELELDLSEDGAGSHSP